MRFKELQQINSSFDYRLELLSFGVLKLLSNFNIRLKAYVSGRAMSNSPANGFESSFDCVDQ